MRNSSPARLQAPDGLRALTSPFSVLKARRWPLLLAAGGMLLFAATASYHYAIYLPQPDQPHRLTILDDLFALGLVVILGCVGLGLGQRLLRHFPLQGLTRLEQSTLALALGWGAVSLGVLVLGMLHLLYFWVLVAGLALALALSWRETWQLFTNLTTRSWYQPLSSIAPRTPFEALLAGIPAIELVLLATQALTFPINPRGWDVYTYHWAAPKLFLLHHAVYALPGWASADFPLNPEMLNLVVLAFNAPIAAVWIQAIFGLLAVFLLCGFLYRHFGRLAAWLGAALCLASPLYTGLMTSGYAEPATACYGIASLVVVLLWLETPAQGDAPRSGKLLLLAGVLAGLGIGAKYQTGMLVAGILLLLVGWGAGQVMRNWQASVEKVQALRDTLRGTTLYLIGVVLALLPWLLKDGLLLGNPIYPFLWGGPGWDAARTLVSTEGLAHFGPGGPLWQRGLLAFWQFFLDNWRVEEGAYLPLNSLVLLAPLSVFVAVPRFWKKGPDRTTHVHSETAQSSAQSSAWLVVAAAAYSLWVISQATLTRYALSWVLVLIVPTVIVWLSLWQLCGRWRLMRQIVQAITFLLLLAGPFTSLSFWVDANPLSLLTGQVSLRQWEEQHLRQSAGYWEMVEYVNSHIPTDAKLLLVGNGLGYFLEGHDYVDDSAEDWVPYLVTAGHTPSGITSLLRQQGFRYLVYEEQNLEYIAHVYQATSIDTYLPAFHQFLASALVQVQVFDDYTLYRIPSS
ncbi:MAG TPA: glycosyltransferase family 39 protein [Ktedonobacterales bacterium]